MTQIESLYLQYFGSISEKMTGTDSPFETMSEKLIEQFDKMGLINEEKAKALTQIYIDESKHITSEASKAALNLLKTDETNQTEARKRQGYDDNIMIEIMKAQAGLASFAVNAASDSAQETIDDLHEVMQAVTDRVCHYACDSSTFFVEQETTSDIAVNGYVYGGTGPTYTVTTAPEIGTLVVDSAGHYTYTPVDDETGVGLFTGVISGVDGDSGLTVKTEVAVTVLASIVIDVEIVD